MVKHSLGSVNRNWYVGHHCIIGPTMSCRCRISECSLHYALLINRKEVFPMMLINSFVD